MPSPSPTKTETDTSSLSIDSVYPSTSVFPIDPTSLNHSGQARLESRQHSKRSRSPSSSGRFPTRKPSDPLDSHNLTSGLACVGICKASHSAPRASDFASTHVGLGSLKLELGRNWPGNSAKRESFGPDVTENDRAVQKNRDQRNASKDTNMGGGIEKGRFVDKASGLPSPPGTESDIATSSDPQASASQRKESLGELRQASHTVLFEATANEMSLHQQSTKTHPPFFTSTPPVHVSQKNSSILTSPFIPACGPPRGTRSMSRSSSSTSVAITAGNAHEQWHSNSLSGSRHSLSSDLSRSGRTSTPLRHGPSPLERSSSIGSSTKSFEITKEFRPPSSVDLNSTINHHLLHRDSDVVDQPLPEGKSGNNHEQQQSRSAMLDLKIKEMEEKIVEVTNDRKRLSLSNGDRKVPVQGDARCNNSYFHSKESPEVSSPQLRRRASKSLDLTRTFNSQQRQKPRNEVNRQDDEERSRSDEKSGGSGNSMRRKGLPEDFRNGSFFSPHSPKGTPNQTPDSTNLGTPQTRSRQGFNSLAQEQFHATLASRFTTPVRFSHEHESVPSPLRPQSTTHGLGRSSTFSITRNGDSPVYSRRAWSQSISELPESNSASFLDSRGLPRNVDKFRPKSVLENRNDRPKSYIRQNSDTPSDRHDRNFRRGMSMLVSNKDLVNAKLRSRITSTAIGPGDSISAVGNNKLDREKDPLDVIRRLEEQMAQSKKRWEHMPRSSTSMSSMRDIHLTAPQTAPAESFRHRRSMERETPLSPTYGRGGNSRLSAIGLITEPRHQRSHTSLGGRSSASLDQRLVASSDHGRLLFEAFKSLESKLEKDSITVQNLLENLGSTAQTAQNVNNSLQAAYELAHQLSLDDIVNNDLEKTREGYVALAVLLKEAGKTSDQNVRDLTKVVFDLPRLWRQSNVVPSTPSGSLRFRRPEAATSSPYDAIKTSEERPRRWTPSAASMYEPVTRERSPLHIRYSVDNPRRSFDVLRSSSSVDSRSLLAHSQRERSSSAVSSLVAKVRTMSLTPRRGPSSPKTDFGSIKQSPHILDIPRVPEQPSHYAQFHSSLSHSQSNSPEKPANSSNVLKKKSSSASNHTIRGSLHSFSSTSRGNPTTAVSQVTIGKPSPNADAVSINSRRTFDEDEPNSPKSTSSNLDAASVLGHNLTIAAKTREKGKIKKEIGGEEGRAKRMTERLKASLRRTSSKQVEDAL
nr:hypothetical protein L204_03498 [Cryptococcus depauperatus CBS 7855]